MARADYKTKLPYKSRGEMKKVAETSEPPIIIPVIVVAVDIHVALAVPPVECTYCAKHLPYHHPSNAPQGCFIFLNGLPLRKIGRSQG